MQPRKTPRLIPDRPHYLTLEVNGAPVDWRIPSIAKCSLVLQMLQKSGIMEAYQKSGEDGEALIATLGDRLPSLFACQGALLGLCWAHRGQDLEATPGHYSTLEAFGEEVFEELHEAGWKLEHVQAVWIDLIGRLVDSFIDQKEVTEKASFLPQATG